MAAILPTYPSQTGLANCIQYIHISFISVCDYCKLWSRLSSDTDKSWWLLRMGTKGHFILRVCNDFLRYIMAPNRDDVSAVVIWPHVYSIYIVWLLSRLYYCTFAFGVFKVLFIAIKNIIIVILCLYVCHGTKSIPHYK